jgi:predicted ATPase
MVDGWLAALADERAAWPLAGRDEELGAIETALARPPAGVLLVGDAGVGKTRLLREALARLRARGSDCDLVVATRAAASIPFGALSHLLPPDVRPDGNPLELLGRFSHRLAGRTGADALVVGVDDAHLLDDASAALLHQLALRGLVTALVTIRLGEPVSDALLALWKETARTLRVNPLAEAAVDELIDRILDAPIDPISRGRSTTRWRGCSRRWA